MKQISKFLMAILLLTFSANISMGQVLISLLFGEALNSEKIEFGLQGGFNRSYLNDIPDASGLNNFNLGFYFHILMKNDSYLSTGVMVKSTVGASGMATYPIGDEDFDALFQNGTLTKKINIFYVPIMFHQRFNNRWYVEAGPVPGLRYTANDIFETKVLDGDLEYKLNARDQYSRLDFALMGGVGYKLRKQLKSTAVGVNYLYGLVDISKSTDTTVKNSSLYIYVKIPIGAGEKAQKSE